MALKQLFAVSVISIPLFAIAQKPTSTTTTQYLAKPIPGAPPMAPMMAMPSTAPLFIQTNGISSVLALVNNASTSESATITLRALDGSQILSSHIVMDGNSQRQIPLATLLSNATAYAGVGNVSVMQDPGSQGSVINAQLVLTDQRNATPAYIDEELAMPNPDGSSMLRGVADAANGPPLLAISNLADKEQNVTIKCLLQGDRGTNTHLMIAPYGTSLTAGCSSEAIKRVDSYLQELHDHNYAGVQGFEISGDGGAGTLAAFAFAPHERENGSEVIFSSVPFGDPNLQLSSTMVYAGVPFGMQTVVTDGSYVPHIALTNFSNKQANVIITIADSNPRSLRDGTLATEFLPQPRTKNLSLRAGESVELVLDNALDQTGLLHSITVESDQPVGQVQSKVVSRGSGSLYEVELLGKDRKDKNNGGGHPWTTQGDYESHLLLFNPSAVPTTFVVDIIAGAKIWEKKYLIGSTETRELSINQIMREAIKDDKGFVLNSDNHEGVVFWSTGDLGHGTGRLLVSSHTAVAAHNFSCSYTILVCMVYVSVNDDGGIPFEGSTNYAYVNVQYCMAYNYNTCNAANHTGGGALINWTLGNNTIVGFTTPWDQSSITPNFTGINPGSTTANVTATLNGCMAGGGGTPPPTVPPTLSINTNLWFFGFGNNPPSTFTLGSNQGVITANGASGGTFSWAITAGTGKVSFASGGTIQNSISTSGNTVNIYSSGFSTSSNDVTIVLTWTPPGGGPVNSSLALQVDSPYRLLPGTPTNRGVAYSGAGCTNPPNGTQGYVSQIPYTVLSFFGKTIGGIGVNENFAYQGDQTVNNWPLYQAGSLTLPANGTFVDNICVIDPGGLLSPEVSPPQSPLSSTAIDYASQAWFVGSLVSSSGPEVQSDTLQRYLDHGSHLAIVSPVR